MASHYETLGVRPDATTAELRAAYLARARALHPDRHAGAPPDQRVRTERAMQAVNAAWAVVGEPGRRRQYDASLARVAPAPPAREGARSAPSWAGRDLEVEPSDDFGPVLPHLVRVAPVLILLAVLGAIFVVTAFATGSRSVDVPPRPTVSTATPPVGACVRVGVALSRVSCGATHDATVRAIVATRAACPRDTVPFVVQGADVVCLAAP